MLPLEPKYRLRSYACALLAAALVAALAAAPASAAPRAAPVPPSVALLVKVLPNQRADGLRALRAVGAREQRTIRRLGVQLVRVPRERAAVAVARLRRARGIGFVERERHTSRVIAAALIPNDPRWPSQWSPVKTNAPSAWGVTTGSATTVVAVVDTGVDAGHPDLRGALVAGRDIAGNDADPSDDQGHGTAVAGIIGARINNSVGVAGYCPACAVMPVKVTGPDGSAANSNLAAGITWAADNGADVINVSLASPSYSDTIAAAVRYASSRNVVVVGGAGNSGNATPYYPAAYPEAIAVAGTDSSDRLYSWSTFGSWVELAAPGCNESTVRGGGFGEVCGTSFAGPVVAGIAGLARSFAPRASAAEIERALRARVASVAGIGGGRIDAAATLAALGAVVPQAPAPAPPAPAAPVLPPAAPAAPPPPASPPAPARATPQAPRPSAPTPDDAPANAPTPAPTPANAAPSRTPAKTKTARRAQRWGAPMIAKRRATVVPRFPLRKQRRWVSPGAQHLLASLARNSRSKSLLTIALGR